MSILGFFNKRGSSTVARERLQLILAHERAESSSPDLVIRLREEILEVIAKHVAVERDKVQIKLERGTGVSTLCVDIELPLNAAAKTEKKVEAEEKADAAPEAKPEKAKKAA